MSNAGRDVESINEEAVERVAEALHNLEYPTYSPAAVRDHNRWSWRGAGDDPGDPKRAMGHLGPNGETDHYDEYRAKARDFLAAALPLLRLSDVPGLERQLRDKIAGEIEALRAVLFPMGRSWNLAEFDLLTRVAAVARGSEVSS